MLEQLTRRARRHLERRSHPDPEKPRVPDQFGEWLKVARTEFCWDYKHFLHMQAVLDRVTARTLKRA